MDMSGKKHKKKKAYAAKANRGRNVKTAKNGGNANGANNANGNGKKIINVIGNVEATTGTPNQKKIALVAYFFTMISFLIPIVYLILKIIFGGKIGDVYKRQTQEPITR